MEMEMKDMSRGARADDESAEREEAPTPVSPQTQPKAKSGIKTAFKDFKSAVRFKTSQQKFGDVLNEPRPTPSTSSKGYIKERAATIGERQARYDQGKPPIWQRITASYKYPSAAEQLKSIGRSLQPVQGGGNSLFESVARQLTDHSLTRSRLRYITCTYGRRNKELYAEFMGASRRDFLRVLKDIEQDNDWETDVGDVVIMMLRDALDVKIVVIQSHTAPQHFPDDGTQVIDSTIVLVRDDFQPHYDSTRFLASPETGPERRYGCAVEQLLDFGLTHDPVPQNGNALFESVARQIEDCRCTNESLRNKFQIYCKENLRMASDLAEQNERKFVTNIELISEYGYWIPRAGDWVIPILAAALDVAIIVIQDKLPLQVYPKAYSGSIEGTEMVVKDVIAIIKHGDGYHYDSTHSIDDNSHGTILEQTQRMGREIIGLEDNGNSLFRSIALQHWPDHETYHESLRDQVCQTALEAPGRYMQYIDPLTMQYGFKQMSRSQTWKPEFRDLIIAISAEVLDLKIVLLRDFHKPLHFPSEAEQPTSRNTIVIVEEYSEFLGTCYYATQPYVPAQEDYYRGPDRPSRLSRLRSRGSDCFQGLIQPFQDCFRDPDRPSRQSRLMSIGSECFRGQRPLDTRHRSLSYQSIILPDEIAYCDDFANDSIV